jgi:uncharacterized protein YjbI with pentapeptide repeats
MLIPSSSNDSNKDISEDSGVYGALGMVHWANLQRMTREELESIITDWRSIHGLPPEVISRDQIAQHIGPEFTHLDLRDTDLSNMDLRCVKLLHCNLSGAKLNSTRLDGASLFGCDLSKIDSWVGSFRCSSFRQCYIVNSRFVHGRFEGASFAHSNLENTKLINSYHDRDTWFFQTRLCRTNLQEAHLEQVNLKEARTLFGVRLHRARLEGAELDYSLFGGKIGEELEREFVQAAQTYSAIKANLEAAGQYNQAARAYVKERQMEKDASAPWNARRFYGESEIGDEYEYSQEHNRLVRTKLGAKWWNPRTWWFYLRYSTKWISDWIVELLCSYGESIWRVLFWMGATLFVIGPTLISLLGGLDWTGDNMQVYRSLSTPLQRWSYTYFQYVLYMIDAFTTADFAQLKPANDLVRLVSGLMAMIGIFLTGLLGFVAGNRIRYS